MTFTLTCQDYDLEWSPTGFRWQLSFVKKLLTKKIWKMILSTTETEIFCFKIDSVRVIVTVGDDA